MMMGSWLWLSLCIMVESTDSGQLAKTMPGKRPSPLLRVTALGFAICSERTLFDAMLL